MANTGKDNVNQEAGIEFGHGLSEGGIAILDEFDRQMDLYVKKYKGHSLSIASIKMILRVLKTRITK